MNFRLKTCILYAALFCVVFLCFAMWLSLRESTKIKTRTFLLSDPNEEVIDKLAADLGLQRVGWIFTDLVADDVRKGTVKHLRDINTFFLTAEECILAGHLQNLYPSPCILSSSGKFGSKFTTVVVSGL